MASSQNPDGPPANRPRPVVLAVLGILGLAFFVQAFAVAEKHSLTWDEPSYMAGGFAYLTRGDFRFNPSHPPLAQLLEGAPLVLGGLRDPGRPYEEYAALGNPVALFGRELFFFHGADPARLALLSRLPITLLGTLLVIAAFAWGRRFLSDEAALVGAGLCALCPNLIAHGGLATEDMACTFFMFIAVWSFHRVAQDPSARLSAWLSCGLATGAALSSKYTALLLLPVYALLALVVWGSSVSAWRRGLRGSLIVAAVSLLVISAVYGSVTGLATYVRGIGQIYQDLDAIQPAFLLGAWEKSRWYYYFAALGLKVSLPVLALVGAGVIVLVREPTRRRVAAFILVPPAVVLAVTMFDPANFGLRRVLPVLPFLFLAAATAADKALRSGRRVAIVALFGALAWTAAETALVYPSYLSYFSAVAGGPANGANLLGDSNIDWGQDLPALAQWQREHADDSPFYLAYFGTSVPAAYGVSALPSPPAETRGPQQRGTYAVSVQILQQMRREAARHGPAYDWLSTHQPVGRAGYSIYIYRFP